MKNIFKISRWKNVTNEGNFEAAYSYLKEEAIVNEKKTRE
jgi:hypothetical protein